MAEMKLDITADPSHVVRMARIIAKHLTAMADELEAPDMLIKTTGKLTAVQVDEIKARFSGAAPAS